MRILVALMAIAVLTATASAQGMGSGKRHKKPEQTTADTTKKKLDEKDYKAALEKIPQSEQKPDPWKNMR